MSDLVLLIFSDGNSIRCGNITDAKNKAIAFLQSSSNLEAVVEITPAGGGLLTSLKFDKPTQDWVPNI